MPTLRKPTNQNLKHIQKLKSRSLTSTTIRSVSHIIKVSLPKKLDIQLSLVVKHRELRLKLIKDTFRDLTAQWDRNFVIFPISGYEDIKLMM